MIGGSVGTGRLDAGHTGHGVPPVEMVGPAGHDQPEKEMERRRNIENQRERRGYIRPIGLDGGRIEKTCRAAVPAM